jgi:hypothetical protein
MIVFDTFPSRKKAQAFADEVKRRFKRKVFVFATEQEQWDAKHNRHPAGLGGYTGFPWGCDPFIVEVERDYGLTNEKKIEKLAVTHGGKLRGT